ncbi:MAG: YigZ family protein [Neisseriaceae bacterium]|nr:YigZ family protein [Neisseriaceae bacterium]
MTDIHSYRTISQAATAEFKDKNSRFLAFAYPILTADDFKPHLDALKKEHFKARHHCFAYRLGYDGTNFRANDDGEPSGSAGRPILGQIDSFEITDTAVIVVRYFGGTLLGVPGLIHAYKTATQMALQNAEIITKNIEKTVQIQCDYATLNSVLRIAKQFQANIVKQDLQIDCHLTLRVPVSSYSIFEQAIGQERNIVFTSLMHIENCI